MELDVKEMLSKFTEEIDYAINEEQKTAFEDRRDAHMWAKGYHKGLAFARDLVQGLLVEAAKQDSEETR